MRKANSSYQPLKILFFAHHLCQKGNKTHDRQGNRNEVSKVFLHYRCPKPGCSKPIVTFGDKTGFHNPFSHLQSCYGRGKTLQEQDIVLKKLFEKARQDMERKGGDNSVALFTHNASAVYGYLRMIILKNLPIHQVTDPEVRRFSKFEVNMVTLLLSKSYCFD